MIIAQKSDSLLKVIMFFYFQHCNLLTRLKVYLLTDSDSRSRQNRNTLNTDNLKTVNKSETASTKNKLLISDDEFVVTFKD